MKKFYNLGAWSNRFSVFGASVLIDIKFVSVDLHCI